MPPHSEFFVSKKENGLFNYAEDGHIFNVQMSDKVTCFWPHLPFFFTENRTLYVVLCQSSTFRKKKCRQ